VGAAPDVDRPRSGRGPSPPPVENWPAESVCGSRLAPEPPLFVHRRRFSRLLNGYEPAKLARSWGRCEGERSTPVVRDARQQFLLIFSRVGCGEAPRASGCFLPLPGKQLDRRRATERRPWALGTPAHRKLHLGIGIYSSGSSRRLSWGLTAPGERGSRLGLPHLYRTP